MKVENLGPIQDSKINLKDFTIFYGNNNTGKTYMSYAIYGVLKYITNFNLELVSQKSIVQILNGTPLILSRACIQEKYIQKVLNISIEDLESMLDDVFKKQFTNSKVLFENESDVLNFLGKNFFNYNRALHGFVFNITNENPYRFEISYENESITLSSTLQYTQNMPDDKTVDRLYRGINHGLNDSLFIRPNILYLPAERIGLNTFRKEIGDYRKKNYSNPFMQDNSIVENTSDFPTPISDYLNYLFEIGEKNSNKKTSKFLTENNKLENSLINGIFEYNVFSDQYYYRRIHSKKKIKNTYKSEIIPFNLTSSSLKSLFGLDYYLEKVARKGDFLIIDEPEMNLHPSKQIIITELLSDLASKGLNILVSTHSNYLIRKMTNILMQNTINQDGLQNENVVAFNFENGHVLKEKSLMTNNFIKNFDETNTDIEVEYFDLLNKLEVSDNDEGN